MKVNLDHTYDEADNITTFFFTPEEPVQYTAGQYVEVTLKHRNPDDRGEKRWFTLSSSPNDKFLSITTKFTDKTGSSFKKALRKLQSGDSFEISSPQGDFVFPKLIQTPLIFVAGGIGITPFHSMLTWLSQTKESRPIKMLYGVNNEDEIVFMDTFKKANVHTTITVSEPTATWGGERGRITAEMIVGIEKPSEDSLIYLSGPKPMVHKLKDDLQKMGISHQQIVTDSFPNYKDI